MNVIYSDIEMQSPEKVYPGEGNINSNPHLANPTAADFRLKNDSPCIRAGTMKHKDILRTDIEGNRRPPPRDSEPDMGAHECEL